MKFIFLMPVIFIVSCVRYYYKAPEKPQSHYIEDLKDRRISLVSFLEIHYKSKSSTTTHFSSSGKVTTKPSSSTHAYAADIKDRLKFGNDVRGAGDLEELNPNPDKEGIAHLLKRYNETPDKLKKNFFRNLNIFLSSKKRTFQKKV